MKHLILLITFFAMAGFSQCTDSTITVRKGTWKNDFIICDSVQPYKSIPTRLKCFDDSRDAYNGYMRAKFVGVGVIIGMAAVLVPFSIMMSAEGSPAGSLLILPLMIPTLASVSIQKQRFNLSIDLYNKHY